MSKVKESLEANQEEILKNLPEEFHADFKKSLESAEDVTPLSDEEEVEAIKAEITENPDVDTEAAMKEFEKDPVAHKSAGAPSEEEQKASMEESLKEVGGIPDEAKE